MKLRLSDRNTYLLAHAAGTDAGNRRMRLYGRAYWNVGDYLAAIAEMRRLLKE